MNEEERTVNSGKLLRLSDDDIAMMYAAVQRQKSDAQKQIRLMSGSTSGKLGLYDATIKSYQAVIDRCNHLKKILESS